MKKINFLFLTIILVMLISCGRGNNSIEEIKILPVKVGEKFQYIDREGKIVINPQFKEATIFRDGLALVQSTGEKPKWGFILEDGKYVINAQYKEATIFSEGLAWVVLENSSPSVINKKGEVKFSLQNAENVRIFKSGLAAFSTVNEEGEEKWGFVNNTGQVIINPQFDRVRNFSEGLCAVRNTDDKWGFIDEDGKIIINQQFDDAEEFKNGKCVVELDEKYGVINNEGKYIINPQFDNVLNDGDIFLIEQDDKWGWCNKDGKIVINPQFDQAYPFMGNKITSIQSGDNYGFIDREGKIVINPQFDLSLPFNGNLAVVVASDKIGFIGKEGKYIINPQFDNISIDMYTYIINGSSYYESAETDYFNSTSIASIINFETPEGFSFNSTFDDVIKKYKITSSKFNKYNTEHKIVSNKKITKDANFDFYVFGNAFDEVRVKKGYGWYEYYDTDYNFNGKNKIKSFGYLISLTGKGVGKENEVITAIQKKLKDYKKDEVKSNENFLYFSNSVSKVELYQKNEKIIILIGKVED